MLDSLIGQNTNDIVTAGNWSFRAAIGNLTSGNCLLVIQIRILDSDKLFFFPKKF